MKLISSNNVDTNRYQLEVAVDANEFNDAIEKVYKRDRNRINLPGFRKGKAPRAFIEKYYGKEVFFNDAIELVYPKALDDAINEAGLNVIEDKIDFELGDVSKEDGFTFKATVTTYPEVTISGYKGLEITPKEETVTSEDVDKRVNELIDRYSSMVTVDREAQDDDIAVIDFEGFMDGEAFEGGKAENYSLQLGTKMMIPGFEDQILGHKAGDEFDIVVTFPEDYQATELAGKEAVFKTVLHEVKGKKAPVFDDEFVKDISEFNTVDELKDDIRNKLVEQKKQEISDDVETQLMLKVNELLEGEIPEAMFEKQIDTEIRAFNYRLQAQKLNFETYMQLTGQNPQTLRQSFRQQAENQVKIRLALEKIGELENLIATEEEIEEEFQNLANMYQLEVEKVKEMISRENQTKDIIARKAMNLVRDSAVSVPAKEEAAEEPAKEAAPKKRATKKAEAAEGEEKPAPKKRTTKKKAEEAAEGEEKPAPKKRATKKKTEEAEGEEKPAPKKRTTKKKAEEAAE